MRIHFVFILLIGILIIGCSSSDKKEEIVTTIYPFKAIIQEIVGDKIKVTTILPGGVDPHTYEMLPSDFKKIQNAAAFFYGGEALDGWAAKISSSNKIELLKLVPKDYLIKIKTFHQHDNHNHSSDIDPHFWTDPITVQAAIPNLLNVLSKLFPEYANEFKVNAENFSIKIVELDKKVKLETDNILQKNVLTSHPFYSYFFERYGFTVAGSIEVSPGAQSTPKDIKNLMELVKTKNVKAIFVHKQHSDKPAKVLAESVGIKEYELDPIGGVAGQMTYEEIVLFNLAIIKEALK